MFERIDQGQPVRACVSAPPRHGKCQPAGSPVLLDTGEVVPIEKVTAGLRCVTLTDDYAFGVETITHSEPNGVKPALRVHLYSGRSIDCTENHPLLTVLGWRVAGSLKVGDSIATASRTPCPDGDPMPDGFAALMGYLIGDGSFGSGQPIVTTADPDVLAHLSSVADSHGWKLSKDGKYTYHVRRKSTHGPRGSSAAEAMREWGMVPGTSHTKRVPPCIFKANRSDLVAFLAAYFNCDGTVNERREGVATFSSVNRPLLLDTQELLTRLGVFSVLRRRIGRYKGLPHESWLLNASGSDLVKMADALPVIGAKGEKLRAVAEAVRARRHFPEHESIPSQWVKLATKSAHWHRVNSGLRFDKKYTRGTAREIVRRVSEIEDNDALRELCAPDLAWERITKIEKLGEQQTYGITVNGTRNYLSGGVVSHNTDTVLHAIAWLLARHPSWLIGYASYSASIAHSKSALARDYARAAGVVLRDDTDAKSAWLTTEGGGLIATGRGGPLTGHGVQVLVIDDPFKNREEADSVTIREQCWSWYTSTARTRLEPSGAILVTHTRWHPDDLIGRLLRGETE